MNIKRKYIGVLVYAEYQDNEILETLNVEQLQELIKTDRTLLSFQVKNIETGQVEKQIKYDHETERDEEILGTTFDAYARRPYSYKTKVRWRNKSGEFRTKKKAEEMREEYNEKSLRRIAQIVSSYIFYNTKD